VCSVGTEERSDTRPHARMEEEDKQKTQVFGDERCGRHTACILALFISLGSAQFYTPITYWLYSLQHPATNSTESYVIQLLLLATRASVHEPPAHAHDQHAAVQNHSLQRTTLLVTRPHLNVSRSLLRETRADSPSSPHLVCSLTILANPNMQITTNYSHNART
jgi:hypothetical protein